MSQTWDPRDLAADVTRSAEADAVGHATGGTLPTGEPLPTGRPAPLLPTGEAPAADPEAPKPCLREYVHDAHEYFDPDDGGAWRWCTGITTADLANEVRQMRALLGRSATTPPARLTTTEWQRQNAAEVRAEQADEIRAAIRDTLAAEPSYSDPDMAAGAVMDRVVRPLIAERDQERQRAEVARIVAQRRVAVIEGMIKSEEGALREALDPAIDRVTAARFTKMFRARAKALADRDATIAALHYGLNQAGDELVRVRAERDRLREADARVRAWAQSWVASTDPGHTLQGAAREILAALEGTDGGESDDR